MLSVASCSGSLIRKRKNEEEYDSESSGSSHGAAVIRKRKHEEVYDSDSSGAKLSRRRGFYFVLESESNVGSSSEDTESILSIQNRSTDYCKDTSDTSSKISHRESDFESLAGVEYEVVSLSEHEKDHLFNSYSSDIDSDISKAERLGAVNEEEGDAESMWGDLSSAATLKDSPSDTPTLLPIPRTCIRCKTRTVNFQYCFRCYKVRKDFFPPRPKGHKKRKIKPSSKNKSSLKNLPKSKTEKSEPCVESSSSQELTQTHHNLPIIGEGLCNVCFKNPKNSAFLHSRWGHVYSCYQCSLKIWFTNKCCPLCNGKIMQVIKLSVG